MANEEKQRVKEYLIFTHVRTGDYSLARRVMEQLDTSRLWILQRDVEYLSKIIDDVIMDRKGIDHAPEHFPEDQGQGFDIKEWDNG